MLNRTFGCARLVWNSVLGWRHQRYHTDGINTSYAQADRHLTELKQSDEFAFLHEVSCVPLQQVLRHQQTAFAHFFAGRARYPRFRSRAGTQAATYTRSAFRWRDGELHLAKMSGPVRMVWSWPEVDPEAISPTSVTVTRKTRGSNNRAKARRKVASAYRKVRNAHRDLVHKTTARLVQEHDTIVIEDLNVHGMTRSAKGSAEEPGRNVRAKAGLNRSITNACLGEFRRHLTYKCERAGRALVVVDRWYPSSKTCSACGCLLAELSLSIRYWTCPSCGARHDRDVNAAKNVLAAGRAVTACGADVSPQGPPFGGRR